MKSVLTLTCLLLFGFVATAQAGAQNRTSAPDQDVMRKLVSIQMIESLASPNAMIRNQTLKNVIVFSTLFPERAELNEAVSSIARVAKRDISDSNRRLAVAALQSIDSYRANRYLAEIENMQPNEVQTLVASVLTEYREARPTGSM